MIAADTILILSDTKYEQDKHHLFVICNDAGNLHKQVIVPVCSWTNNLCDPTCILCPEDHDFIRHKSYILYRKARIETAETLVNGVRNGIFTTHKRMNGQSFLRIQNSVLKSLHTPRMIKNFFQDFNESCSVFI